MITRQMTFLIPPYGTATLTLPELVTPEVFARLDSVIGRVLGESRQGLGDAVAPEPGSVEFDSWLIQRH